MCEAALGPPGAASFVCSRAPARPAVLPLRTLALGLRANTRFAPASSLLLLLLAGCATPIPPSGGPEDRTPPRLVASDPASGAVNVRAERLMLEFSEPVDEASLRQALAVSPGWDTPPEVRVRGRRAEIIFPDSLRPNTTYVLTLDTNLRDLRRVAVREPITLAFATGPALDRGRIAGRVLDPQTGTPVAGFDVFAYALADSAAQPPDPRAAAPDYRTQTDQSGRFTLGHLREAPFFVVGLADRNRNRRADAGEPFAAPPSPVVRADTLGGAELTFFRTALDTVPPEPLRVRTLSDRRFAIRFTEPIRLLDTAPDAWALEDSTSGQMAAIEAVYADVDVQQVVLRTEPLAAHPHRLALARAEAVVDSAGNAARPLPLTFTPAANPDTLRLRLLEIAPEADALAPTQRPVLRFSEPADSVALAARVAVTDTAGAALPFEIAPEDGARYRLRVETEQPFVVAVAEGDSAVTRTFRPLARAQLGDLAGVIVAPSDSVIVEAVGPQTYRAEADATGAFTLAGLPEAEYRLRFFVDENGNGRWDGGHLAPYAPPEPLGFAPAPWRVRPRWETVVDTLRIVSGP